MSGVSYVRFFPSNWRSGCIGLTLEQQGLYVAICSFRWDTGRRVPADRQEAARLLHINRNKYEKVLNELIEAGKLVETRDGLVNDRAEAEFVAAERASGNDRKAEIDPRSVGATGDDSIADTPPVYPPSIEQEKIDTPTHTPHHTPPVYQGGTGGNSSMISTREEELEQEQENKNVFSLPVLPREPASNVKPVTDWRTAFAQPEDHPTITMARGKIELHNGTRSEWLARFDGDAESLDLALLQAAGWVQPNNISKPLEAQVSAQLAKIANDFRQRRKNLAAVKAASSPPKSKTPAHLQRY